ncbi:MAG: tetratricopeptide repeat protein [Magnetococcales bacterium]|nr:tetratricopeptide repeat protein [Magnetococcales bacterium]
MSGSRKNHAAIATMYAQAVQRFQQGETSEAEALCHRILALDARHGDALHLLGMTLHRAGQREAAVAWVRRAIAVNERQPWYHCNLGVVLKELGRLEEAIACYRHALALKPDYHDAYNNLGNALRALGDAGQAEAAYRSALAIQPAFPDCLNNFGNLLLEQSRLEEAEACWRRLLALRPNSGEAWVNLGKILRERERFDDATACFRQALALVPDSVPLTLNWLNTLLQACDWEEIPQHLARLRTLFQAGRLDGNPYLLLQLPVSSAEVRTCAQNYGVRMSVSAGAAPLGRHHANDEPERLVIGYLSGDLRNHPVGHLMAGVFEAHDPNRVAVIAYSHGGEEDHPIRRRIREGCERFVDLDRFSHRDAARRIAEDGVHILVDLQGYTRGNRLGILAHRPAPVQATWLGYPGTLGKASLVDYLIGDPVATPPEHAGHFSETLALLPHCLLPGFGNRFTKERCDRAAAGLPDEGFVFCSFNNPGKFNPETFDVWCRLLHEVPGSLLWLRASNAIAEARLRQEALRRGIASGRVVFARKTPTREEHLSRLALADLALDTLPYNSHVTGMDALWSGVPLVTSLGEGFAGRVGASMLHALGLPELIAVGWEEYDTIALDLARDAERLQEIRRRLSINRLTFPLFDLPRFVRNLERLYERMWRDWRAGKREMIVLQDAERPCDGH